MAASKKVAETTGNEGICIWCGRTRDLAFLEIWDFRWNCRNQRLCAHYIAKQHKTNTSTPG